MNDCWTYSLCNAYAASIHEICKIPTPLDCHCHSIPILIHKQQYMSTRKCHCYYAVKSLVSAIVDCRLDCDCQQPSFVRISSAVVLSYAFVYYYCVLTIALIPNAISFLFYFLLVKILRVKCIPICQTVFRNVTRIMPWFAS